MSESEKDPKKPIENQSRKKIKASTGAWWKSTVVTVDEAKPEPTEKKTTKAPASGPRKPRSRKSAPSAPKKSPQAPATGESTSSQKKRSTPSSRKKKDEGASTEKKVESHVDQITPEPVTERTEPAETAQEQIVPDEKSAVEKPKRPRQSRGRRGGRKKTTTQKSTEPVSKQSATGSEESKEEEAGQSVEQKQPRKQGKTAPDKKVEEEKVVARGPQPVVKLLINAEEPEECRLALLEDGRLESIHVTTVGRIQTKNNIYKARVVAIEPNLQAAFIDYGTDKNGFLPFSEIHPEYYRQELSPAISKLVEAHQWKKLSISDVLERGQELLVQVVKEEIGSKGANMTTYLSIPGRCVVMMPGSDSEGISRRISGEERRGQLRDVMNSFDIPEGIGWIVRTASVDITKTALSKDVRFLLKLWREIKSKGQHLEGVGLLYQDYNCVMRFLREYYDPCIQEILVDNEEALEKVRDFVEMLPAKQRQVKVKHHRGARPIFNQYSVEDQIESIYQPRVNLPSGGSIVIDPTEALVAIDVNSGSTSKGKNFEETIFQANMEAATELARQLRLRDLGGLVVVDFIDMRNSKHVREVERQVKTAMKRDKAKVDISRISRFGLMQISRQKMGSPIESGNYKICEHCRGRGTVRSVETQALFYFRRIHTGASRRQVTQINCRFPLDVAEYLLNNKRYELIELEEKYQTRVVVTADPGLKPSEHEITFQKAEKEENPKKQA